MRSRPLVAPLIIAAFTGSLLSAIPASAASPGFNGAIAFETVDAQGAPWIGVFHPGQQGVSLLITMPDIRDPAWSPDGTKIAFAARSTAGSDLRIFVADADGTGTVAVSAGPNDDEPAWSPDGADIAFTHHGAGATAEVGVLDLATDSTSKISGILAAATSPAWSPTENRIAVSGSYLIGDPGGPCGNACATGLFILPPDGTGTPLPLLVASPGIWTEPDWSPDGTRILVTVGDPSGTYGVVPVSATDGRLSGPLIGLRGTAKGAWSPDGSRIAVDTAAAPLSTSNIIVIYDLQGVIQTFIAGPVAGPSWAATVATPPTIDVTMTDLRTGGWTRRANAFIQVTASQVIVDIACDVDGGHPQSPLGNYIDPYTFYGLVDFYVADGDHVLSCTVTDGAGHSATDSAAFKMDGTAPTLSNLSVVPLVRRTDQVSVVKVDATDELSGIDGGEIAYSGFRGSGRVPMTLDGSSLQGTLGSDLPSGMYQLSTYVSDRAGNSSFLQVPLGGFIVFDTESSTAGHGSFVPTTATAKLPGIDNHSSLRFRFGINYAKSTALTPVGSFAFDYAPGGVHMKATSFDWLAHFDDRTYEVLGTATVADQPGSFRFRAVLTDGVGAEQDGFSVTVWPQGTVEPSSPFGATYAAWASLSGNTIVNDGP
jgi:hypothetical protein